MPKPNLCLSNKYGVTVKELIDYLQQCPPDHFVSLNGEEFWLTDASSLYRSDLAVDLEGVPYYPDRIANALGLSHG